jgi:hypothetical protein
MFSVMTGYIHAFFIFAFSPKLISGEHIGALAMSEPNCQYHSNPVAALFFSSSTIRFLLTRC